LPSWWRGRADRAGDTGGAPPATRGRTTLALARSGAWLANEGRRRWLAQGAHLLTAVVVSGVCVRTPSLIWVRGPSRVRRQDDRWGIPRSARPRSLLRPSTDQPWRQGARGRWPQHICLPVGRARSSHLGQAAAATGRSSTGASAASPRLTRV